VSGEGNWQVSSDGSVLFSPNAFNGDPTPIHYTIKNTVGIVSNEASIILDYCPVLSDDSSTGNQFGDPVTIAVLSNDTTGDTVVPATLQIVGTSSPGDSLVVPNEGTWSVNLQTGEITFTPEPGFEADPTPVSYIAEDEEGNVAEPASVSVAYEGTTECDGFPLTLVIDDASTEGVDIIIVDNQPIGTETAYGASTHADEASVETGSISFRGTTSGVRLIAISALSKPVLTADYPNLELFAEVISLEAAEVQIIVSDGCYSLEGGQTYDFVSPIGGTTHGTVLFDEILDPDDLPFGTGPDAITNSYTTPKSGAFSSSSSQTYAPTTDIDVSITKSITIRHGGGYGISRLGVGGSVTQPSLDQIDDLVISQDAPEHFIELSGISSGGGSFQTLSVSAVSSNPNLIPDPDTVYTFPDETGTLKFTPQSGASGTSSITVTVESRRLANDGTGEFTVASQHNGGQKVCALETADFDGDGVLDLVTVNTAANTISLLKGTGDNQFTELTQIYIGHSPQRVSPGDFNNDGEIDLAVTRFDSDDIAILLGNGDGTFSNLRAISSGDGPIEVRTMDLNGDRRVDLIILNKLAGGIAVHYGNGDGTFETPTFYAAGICPCVLELADLNQDGIPDLVTNDLMRNVVNVLLGNGDGTFQPVVSTQIPGESHSLTTGDFNDDGFTDVVTANRKFGLTLLLGSGDGSFSAVQQINLVNKPTLVSNGDFNYDGKNDLLVAGNNDELLILNGNNNATFELSGTLPVSNTAKATLISDLNNDGVLDIVAAIPAEKSFTVLSGTQRVLSSSTDRTFTVTVEPTQPTIVSPVSSTAEQRPRLEWTAVPSAASYEVWIGNASTGQNPYLKSTTNDVWLDVPKDLGVGKMDLWVRGVDQDGHYLPWSGMNRFTVTSITTVPDMPRRQVTSRPLITWPEVPGAASYDVWVNNRSTGESQYLRDEVTENRWTPAAEMDLAEYHIWVRARAADGFSANWGTRQHFYVTPTPTVTSPVNSTFDRTPTFQWGEISGATSYGIQIRSQMTGNVIADLTGLQTPEYTPVEALSDGPYVWWGVAESSVAGLRSNWTRRTEFYVGGRTQVTGPTNPPASSLPMIEWQDVDGAVRYELWISADGTTLIADERQLTETRYEVTTPLKSGVRCDVWVRAVSGSGEFSSWSRQFSFTVSATEASESQNAEDHPGEEIVASALPDLLPQGQPTSEIRSEEPLETPATTEEQFVTVEPAADTTTDAALLFQLFQKSRNETWYDEFAEAMGI
jgi:CshA-type fibril repeat protein